MNRNAAIFFSAGLLAAVAAAPASAARPAGKVDIAERNYCRVLMHKGAHLETRLNRVPSSQRERAEQRLDLTRREYSALRCERYEKLKS